MTDDELIARLTALIANQDAALLKLAADTPQTCSSCDATWYGQHDDPCGWCADALERQREAQRQLILHPTFLDAEQGPRYDELDELDKAVWRATRGGDNGGSALEWARRLRRAVNSELVTEHEAEQAIERYRATT